MSLKGKIAPVEDYLEMRNGSTQIREEWGIRLSPFQAWLRKYLTEGTAGLHPKKCFIRYPSSLKLEAVEDYLGKDGSLDAMCRKYRISSHAVLQQWIMLYYKGHRDLKTRRAQEESSMAEKRKLSYEERRQAVLYCIRQQLDYRQTSEQYKITYQQIYSWVKKHQEQGKAGLLDRREGNAVLFPNTLRRNRQQQSCGSWKRKTEGFKGRNDFLKNWGNWKGGGEQMRTAQKGL